MIQRESNNYNIKVYWQDNLRKLEFLDNINTEYKKGNTHDTGPIVSLMANRSKG